MNDRIKAVVFDCYGTLVNVQDNDFADSYAQICHEQGLEVEGRVFFDKWMDVWRRAEPSPAVAEAARNEPGPLSEAEALLKQRVGSTSAGRNRSLDGEPPPFRLYRDEWPEHFAICFEELGLDGDADAASERLRQTLAQAVAFPEARRVVETLARRVPIAVLSNADNDFLLPCLARNGLTFPVVVSSEDVAAYKPHISIFSAVSDAVGVPLTEIVYVGDSRTADVAGSKHAGMYSAWINRRGIAFSDDKKDRDFSPDFEISSLDELLSIIDDTE